MDQKECFIKIGDLAAQAGVTVRTLRYYEELGLLSPSEIRSGGVRFYTDADSGKLLLIKRFKDLGFSLEGIRKLLDTTDFGATKEKRIEASYSLFEKQLEQIELNISELERSKNSIEQAIEALRRCRKCSQPQCPPNCSTRKVLLK